MERKKQAISERVGKEKTIRVVSLFCGIGGFEFGLKQVSPRFKTVWANEIDRWACQIYRRNYGTKNNTKTGGCGQEESILKQGSGDISGKSDKRQHTVSYLCPELHEGDITKVNTDDIPDHDLLVGGFPCQAFSIAGKRRGFDDTRGTLFFEIARICRAKKPRLILLENVKGLLSHEHGKTFQTILKVLSNIGYVLQWQVLNSKNFGVPQNRERVFIIGHSRGTSRPEVFPIGENDQMGKGSPLIANTITANYWKGPAGSRPIPTDGVKIRRLTPTECERLQGFPDGWTEKGLTSDGNCVTISDTQRYKTLGNAITCTVVTEIGRRLL